MQWLCHDDSTTQPLSCVIIYTCWKRRHFWTQNGSPSATNVVLVLVFLLVEVVVIRISIPYGSVVSQPIVMKLFTHIRPTYLCAGALTYLLTHTVGSGSIKPAISPKQLKIEWKLLLTHGLYKIVDGFSIAAKMNDLEWPLIQIQGHWFHKCRKNGEIQLSNDSDVMYSKVAGCIASVRRT